VLLAHVKVLRVGRNRKRVLFQAEIRSIHTTIISGVRVNDLKRAENHRSFMLRRFFNKIIFECQNGHEGTGA